MNQKKRDLSEWERSECAALKAAIEEYNRARPKKDRITQEQAGAALGMNQGSFSNYLNGRLAINLDFALKVSRLFDIPVERFSKRLAQEIDDISSSGNKLPEVEHYLAAPPLYENDNFEKLIRKKYQLKSTPDNLPDYVMLNDRMTVNVFNKSPLSVRDSLAQAVHKGVATPNQIRLRHLMEKLQDAVDNDRITEKDFELLESMLDRLVDMAAPYRRETNEHFEKH